MANLDAITVPEYQPLEPYRHEFDNKPLKVIIQRQDLLNNEVTINSQILREAIGDQGTLSNRLNQSLNENGSLKSEAMDTPENSSGDVVLHNIAAHRDGTANLSSTELSDLTSLGYSVSNPVNFVRMLEAERDKLALIDDEATAIDIAIETPSATITFENGTLEFVPSDSIVWNVTDGTSISAIANFSTNSLHTHVYDVTPVHQSLSSPDYTNYKTTSVATVFVDGSLRVFINGIRLPESSPGVFVPPSSGPDGTWTQTYFTSDSTAGTFALNRAITSSDVIRIDFDTLVA